MLFRKKDDRKVNGSTDEAISNIQADCDRTSKITKGVSKGTH
jgi:hypothetical protein